MMSMSFGHTDQPTSESTVHEAEVLGELCQQLKSDDGRHGDISALSQVHERTATQGYLTGQGIESISAMDKSQTTLAA